MPRQRPRRFTPAGRLALAASSGLLLPLGYPPFACSAIAWIALAPLLIALEGAAPLLAAALGWLTGTLLGLGVAGYWLWRAAIDYFGLGTVTAAAFTLGLIELFVAPFVALFALLVARIASRSARLLIAPAAFVATEYARVALLGNAWELLGHAQRALPLLQLADLTGAYGLSFLSVLSAAAIAQLLPPHDARAASAWWARALRTALIVGAAVGLPFAYGSWRLAHLPSSDEHVRVLLVQGNVSNRERADAQRAPEVLQRYLTLTRGAEPIPPLAIWPENAIAVFPESNAALLAPLRELARSASTTLLAGAPRAGERPGVAAIYNSLYVIDAGGARSVYDKRRLLPFVERLALRAGDGPYLPGDSAAPVHVGAARLGPLICFEIIYPELARGLVADGANLLVNVSNDSWFDAGAGPAQHYELARFRAVENHVALVRATNSGISGAFDPAGREIARLPVGAAAAQAVDVPLVTGGSPYSRYGDWFVWLCIAATVGGSIATDKGKGEGGGKR